MWEVTELEEGRSFTWVTRSPGLGMIAGHRVDAVAGGSRATLSLRFSGLLGPLVGRVASGRAERYVTLEAHGLKERSEHT